MKTSKYIIRTLYNISCLWFVISIIGFAFNIYFLFSKDHIYYNKSKNTSTYTVNPFKDGYPIPAKLSIKIPSDTAVKWKSKKSNSSGSFGLNKNQAERYELADSILNDTAQYSKEIIITKWGISPPFNSTVTSEILDSAYYQKTGLEVTISKNYQLDTTLNLRSKSYIKNLAFALFYMLGSIFNLIIAFNTFKLFKKIVTDITFINPLNKFIFNIGFTLITWQMCKFLLNLTYSKWFGSIGINDLISTSINRDFIIYLNPSNDSSLTLILFGVTLIALSYLFKYGNKLEQDQALTI